MRQCDRAAMVPVRRARQERSAKEPGRFEPGWKRDQERAETETLGMLVRPGGPWGRGPPAGGRGRCSDPPFVRVMTTVAERGRLVEAASVWLAGRWLVMVVRLPSSPGCWTLVNIVLRSGSHGDAGDLSQSQGRPRLSHSGGGSVGAR